MNTEIQTAGLAERAILMSLEISAWSAKKTDKKVTAKAIGDAKAHRQSGEFRKRLIKSDIYDQYRNLEGQARSYLDSVSFPFLGKMKLVPLGMLDDVRAELRDFRIKAEKLRDEFIDSGDYARSVADAHNHLGSMFDPADYPDPEVVRARFKFTIGSMPIPPKGDWPHDLEKATRDDLVQELGEQYKIAHNEVVAKLLGRLGEQVAHMLTRLEGEEKHLKFTLVKSMRSLVGLMPIINISKDPELDTLIDNIRDELCQFEVTELRADPAKMKGTKKSAKKIGGDIEAYLKKMSAFVPAK
tara:strand:- start:468 stop:1364 length:897 start_codon:yes stop_codon:yes gene_type:complete